MSIFKTITAKPWERKGVIGGLKPEGAFNTFPEKVTLGFFLAVVSILFALFMVSYNMRMGLADWQPLAEPSLLWFNTALLVLSSVLFQWATNISKSGHQRNLMTAFIGGGVLALLFIAGQLVTWQTLQAEGFYLASNPANSYYYLLTGVHAVHLLGGLWVWSKSSIRLLSGAEVNDVRKSIELCTIYWHFLLLVWLVLFAVMANT